MRTWYLLPKPGDLNDATEYYVRTIGRASEALGRTLERVDAVAALPHCADVLTIDCRTALKVSIVRPLSRVWVWTQGVAPEEAALHFGDRLRDRLRTASWAVSERAVFLRARGIFMVSEAMRRHYVDKYRFRRPPAFVMPCVNQELSEEAFNVPSKYAAPTFVYAGSLYRWQCFELTLEVFKRIRARCPAAKLTILTGDQAGARAALRAASLQDVEVSYVPLDALQQTLRAFKYGFVLREPHIVNHVATPTKVSSYMAAGVIPVTTAAVGDYTTRLGALENVVMSPEADPEAVAARVLAFEARAVSPQRVLSEYRRVFEEYFDHARYLPALTGFLEATGLHRAPA